MTELAGKTIARVKELEYSKALIFTDGTAVELQPTGYEADGVDFEPLCSEMDIIHQQALDEDACRAYQATMKRIRERYEAQEMQGLELAIYQEYLNTYNSLRVQLNQQFFGQQFNQQFIGQQFVVPVKKP